MTRAEVCSGLLLEEHALSIEEFACACAVDADWVVQRAEAGLLGALARDPHGWRFASEHLVRARRMLQIERTFEADSELAALVADLLEELDRLRR